MNYSLEQEIISVYDKNIYSFYSINQISKKLNKTYPYINKKVSYMIKENILKKYIMGNSYLCSPNLNNEKTVILLTLNEIKKRDILLKKDKSLFNIINSIDSLKKKITIHAVALYNQKLYFVLENLDDKKIINDSIKFKSIFLTKSDFQTSILKGKIINNYVVLYGFSKFFEFIQEIYLQLKMDHLLFNS